MVFYIIDDFLRIFVVDYWNHKINLVGGDQIQLLHPLEKIGSVAFAVFLYIYDNEKGRNSRAK